MPDALPPFRHWDCGGPRPVLALHCSLAHSGAWAGLAHHLRGVALTASDHPGHGRAEDWDGEQDYHALATRQATALAQQLAMDGAIDLIGHSFGGTVALRIALENPDLIRSVTLVEPVIFAAARGTPAFDRMPKFHADLPALIARDREKAATLFHTEWGDGTALADLPERQRRYITDRIHLVAAANPALVDDNAGLTPPGRFEGLDVPVLLIEGANSPEVVGAINGALAARLPRANRLIVPCAGHMVPISHAAQVALAVQEHMDAI